MFAISAPLARTLSASPLGGPLNVSVGIENPQNLPPGVHDIGFYDVDIGRRFCDARGGTGMRTSASGAKARAEAARKTGERPDRTTGGNGRFACDSP
jgi:hypothetical protein